MKDISFDNMMKSSKADEIIKIESAIKYLKFNGHEKAAKILLAAYKNNS